MYAPGVEGRQRVRTACKGTAQGARGFWCLTRTRAFFFLFTKRKRKGGGLAVGIPLDASDADGSALWLASGGSGRGDHLAASQTRSPDRLRRWRGTPPSAMPPGVSGVGVLRLGGEGAAHVRLRHVILSGGLQFRRAERASPFPTRTKGLLGRVTGGRGMAPPLQGTDDLASPMSS